MVRYTGQPATPDNNKVAAFARGARFSEHGAGAPRRQLLGRYAISGRARLGDEERRSLKEIWFFEPGEGGPAPKRFGVLGLLLLTLMGCQGVQSYSTEEGIDIWNATMGLHVGALGLPEPCGGEGERDCAWYYSIRDLEVGPSGLVFVMVAAAADNPGVFKMDQEGRILGTLGDSPRPVGRWGEYFSRAKSMGWAGDSLWVFDENTQIFSLFSHDGDVIGRVPALPNYWRKRQDRTTAFRIEGMTPGGTIFGAYNVMPLRVARGEVTHRTLIRVDPWGSVLDSLPSFPFGREYWPVVHPGAPDRAEWNLRQPFADNPLWNFVPGEDALLLLDREAPLTPDTATFSLTKVSFSGDTLFQREYRFLPIPVRIEEVQREVDRVSRDLSHNHSFTPRDAWLWAEPTFYRPRFWRGVDTMVVANEGGIWLRLKTKADSASWLVLDEKGLPQGRVSLPDEFRVAAVIQQEVWGLKKDQFWRDHLLRFEIDVNR